MTSDNRRWLGGGSSIAALMEVGMHLAHKVLRGRQQRRHALLLLLLALALFFVQVAPYTTPMEPQLTLGHVEPPELLVLQQHACLVHAF